MKNTFCKALVTLALVVTLLGAHTALGAARFPVSGGVVTDDANVLSQTMAKDISDYADKLEDETDVQLHVALVQFLDGETVQTYADTLFTRWELNDNDLLLLGAAAEDTFAFSAGSKVSRNLSDGSLKSLLYSSGFSDAFKVQQYDMAFGKLFVSFNDVVAKQYNETIKLKDLFAAYQSGAAQPAPTARPNTIGDVVNSVWDSTSSLWTSSMDSVADSVQDYQNYNSSRNEERTGLTPTGWIVLVIIVLIVIGQSDTRSRAKKKKHGCSPVGWILAALGASAWFNGKKRR